MTTVNLEDSSRFPVGKFHCPEKFTEAGRRTALAALRLLPSSLSEAVSGLSQRQLEMPYREGGWTLRQVVHHVADSHLNAYTRTRLALTEDWPTIKPYEQDCWADLIDAKTLPVDVSLSLLEPLHTRWLAVLEDMDDEDWQRGYNHPALGRQTLNEVVLLYAWHSRHHTGHIVNLRHRMQW